MNYLIYDAVLICPKNPLTTAESDIHLLTAMSAL